MSKSNEAIKSFTVSKRYDESSVPSGLSRDEVVERMEQRAKELGDSIKERFPQVVVTGVSWSGPSIYITGTETKKSVAKLIQQIQTEFDCTITPYLQ